MPHGSRTLFHALIACAGLAINAWSQSPAEAGAPPAVPREMRAIWIATVDNMDWPSRAGLPTEQQKSELVAILDKAAELRMNAVILQVRPEADALYASKLEPWSEYLTGTMGRAPDPYYDPLTFAIAESHKRGLELHVWINPYRARYSKTRPASKDHISRAQPKLVRQYGSYLWMDPGDPAVRERTKRVVYDLVRRYDIDGVHMDDYFYPYRERKRGRDIPFPDATTYARYHKKGGTLGRDDWRRENVNLLVHELYDGIHDVKPWVRFGVSPFGIWRPGNPLSVRGLDQYTEIYADAKKWWNQGWVDYLVPQLYWSVDKPQQRYDLLLAWWAQQNTKGRHLWPGNYTGKVAFTNSAAWRTDEVLEQIRLTRAQPGASGNVHFSAKVFMQNPDNLDGRLRHEAYAQAALPPASTWLPGSNLPAPQITPRVEPSTGDRYVDFRPASATIPSLWVVQIRGVSGWTTEILPGSYRGALFAARGAAVPLDVRVSGVDRVGNLSPAARFIPVR
ncbi:glycoside hydrolase family 10 protein [soil metagenome]